MNVEILGYIGAIGLTITGFIYAITYLFNEKLYKKLVSKYNKYVRFTQRFFVLMLLVYSVLIRNYPFIILIGGIVLFEVLALFKSKK